MDYISNRYNVANGYDPRYHTQPMHYSQPSQMTTVQPRGYDHFIDQRGHFTTYDMGYDGMSRDSYSPDYSNVSSDSRYSTQTTQRYLHLAHLLSSHDSLFPLPIRLAAPQLTTPRSTAAPSTPITHTRPHCAHPDCLDASGAVVKFFTRKADASRHRRTQHEDAKFDCPRNRCPRKGANGFTRNDHRNEHLRTMHGVQVPTRASRSGSGDSARER
jgi:hypothetical protein